MPTETSCEPAVLIIDDDDEVRSLLAAILTDAGFPVRLAASGKEAVVLYRQHRQQIGLVLLDVRMPGQDGPSTLAELLEFDPKVRCCFLSGQPGLATPEDLLARGAMAFVAKPFRVPQLIGVVQRLAHPEAIPNGAIT